MRLQGGATGTTSSTLRKRSLGFATGEWNVPSRSTVEDAFSSAPLGTRVPARQGEGRLMQA